MTTKRSRTTASVPVLAVILTALTIGVPPERSWAEDIDLRRAVSLALESNLGVQSEALDVAQRRLIATTWWNRFYPTSSVSYAFGRLNQPPAISTTPQTFMSSSLDLSLVLTLQTIPGVSLARLDYEAGLISLDDARARVERDVSKQFYDLILLREQADLSRERIDAAQRRFEQARVNFDNGLIDEFTLLSSEVQVANLRPALTALEASYEQVLLAFKDSLGLPLSAPVTPIGRIDPPTVTIVSGSIGPADLEARFDVLRLRQLDRILREQRRAADFDAQGGRMPFLRFGWSVDPTFAGDPLADNWLDRDLWNQSSGAFTVSIVQPLDPWFPSSLPSTTRSDFDTRIARNRLSTEQALRAGEIVVVGLLLAIETSQETIGALRDNIALARRAFELAEIGYQNGLRDLIEVESAEVDLRDAELQLLREQKSILDSVLDLRYELNRPLEEIAQSDPSG